MHKDFRRDGSLFLLRLFMYSIVSLLLTLFALYIAVSYVQKDKPPVDFTLSIPEAVSPGNDLYINIGNIYRYKICPYRRFVSILDKDGVWHDGQEVPNYPGMQLGKNPDIEISITLDPKTALGPAVLNYVVEFTCPENFFHAVLNQPFVLRKSLPIDIVEKPK